MQSLYLPTPVVLLCRRIVNAVSTISISQQLLTRQVSPIDVVEGEEEEGYSAKLWEALKSLPWPKWISSADESSFCAETNAIAQTPKASLADSEEITGTPGARDLNWPGSNADTIHKLIHNPVLYDPLRKPRNPIALCHGLYGFDVRGPSTFPILQTHYWSNVLSIVRDKLGAEVIVTSVPSTGSIASRAESLDRFLREKAQGRGINFMAHSMGGLDCRHLISRIRPIEYTPLSLTTIATPHRGSPFMDWCKENLGIGRLRHREQAAKAAHVAMNQEARTSPTLLPPSDGQPDEVDDNPPSSKSTVSLASLPSSFTMLLLSLLDSPAYANLTSNYLNMEFNPATPDHPSVKYFSVAGRIANVNVWHPLWLPKMVLDGFEEKERERLRETGDQRWQQVGEWGNDALVTVQSAKWGEYLGTMEGCDHWNVRGARGIEVDLPSVSVPGLRITLGGGKAKDQGKNDEDDGWNLADWSKFVRAWKKEEKEAARSAGKGISEQKHGENKALATGRTEEKEQADEVVKSSTDKLSAVFDWIVDQVPNPLASSSNPSRQNSSEASLPDTRNPRDRSRKLTERNELATKMDLERFYVALCRKLYDEGL